MTREMSQIDVAEIVTTSIREALLAPQDIIVPSARLFSDLEAESIDIVDIRFRIEQAIGSKIDQGAMTDYLGKNLTAVKFDNLFTVQFIIDYVRLLLDQREKNE
ncbi:MAG: hypothetical protein KOO62_12150 [candidate division Zixibacteria bacterium]|nr:hypothetical protein [candidate division Zixibacteria bacterium]